MTSGGGGMVGGGEGFTVGGRDGGNNVSDLSDDEGFSVVKNKKGGKRSLI